MVSSAQLHPSGRGAQNSVQQEIDNIMSVSPKNSQVSAQFQQMIVEVPNNVHTLAPKRNWKTIICEGFKNFFKKILKKIFPCLFKKNQPAEESEKKQNAPLSSDQSNSVSSKEDLKTDSSKTKIKTQNRLKVRTSDTSMDKPKSEVNTGAENSVAALKRKMELALGNAAKSTQFLEDKGENDKDSALKSLQEKRQTSSIETFSNKETESKTEKGAKPKQKGDLVKERLKELEKQQKQKSELEKTKVKEISVRTSKSSKEVDFPKGEVPPPPPPPPPPMGLKKSKTS